MQAASWTGPGIILSGIAIPPSRYWRERSLPLHSMCARQFGAEERVQGPGLSPRPFSLSKKSSESWAFSFARGKIAIGGEKDAGTREDGSQCDRDGGNR